MEQSLLESVNKLTVDGNRLILPAEKLTNYPKVRALLEKHSGSYKKIKGEMGFTFPDPAQNVLDRINGGKESKRKEFQFYATKAETAKRIVEFSEIGLGGTVLEPSAGDGALIKALPSGWWGEVTAVEIRPECHAPLQRVLGDHVPRLRWNLHTADFLDMGPLKYFDYIIANPPFSKNRDIQHVRKMFKHLSPGGIMVSVMSKHYQISQHGVCEEFRDWLTEVEAEVVDLPAGAFENTNIEAVMVKIRNRDSFEQ